MQGDFEQPSPAPTEEEMIVAMTPREPDITQTAPPGIHDIYEPFATGPDVEYPIEPERPAVAGARDVETEERPFTEPERTVMGRAADKAYEPPAKMVVDIEKNIKTLIANTPADKREQSKEFWGYMAPRVPEIVAGKIKLEQAIHEVYPRAGGIIVSMINANAPGGVQGVQNMLLSKSPDTTSIAVQILQAYGTTDWGK